MANIKISELPPATTLLNADEFPLNQSGTTKKSTIGQIKNSVGGFPTGGVLMFAASGVPAGWLECDGSILSINLYSDLYNVVGQNFKTSTTFNTLTGFQIPDLRGQFVRGWDHGANVDSGRVFGKTQEDLIKSHDHPFYWGQNAGTPAIGGSTPGNSVQNYNFYGIGADQIGNTGGTETRPKNVALLYCIKT
jgi:microcystin-dependent protein